MTETAPDYQSRLAVGVQSSKRELSGDFQRIKQPMNF
jgi:hypothetical protein